MMCEQQPLPVAPDVAPAHRRLLCLVFFASGAAGLLFEMLWFYQASLALGNSFWAASVVITAFMGGLAIGNLAAMMLGRSAANSVRTYALVELVIAVAGSSLVFLFPSLGRLVAPLLGQFLDQPFYVNLFRFLAALAILLVPSTAMGMTLPVLTRALCEGESGFGEILGRLYGLNTLGAVAGSMAGELALIGWIGIRGTALVAASLNIVAAITAWWLSGRCASAPARTDTALNTGLFPRGMSLYWLSVALGGFLLLALEVVWIRFLSLFVGNSSLAFATMLAVVLAGIAFGGLAASTFLRRCAWASRTTSSAPFVAGALCSISYAAFPVFLWPLEGPLNATSAVQILQVGLPLMFPVSFLSGVFFTLAGAGIRGFFRSSQVSAGVLTLFNTIGAALGAVVAGFVLIPRLGMEYSLFLLALVYGVAGALWWSMAREPKKFLCSGVTLWMGSLVLFPFGTMERSYVPQVAARWSRAFPYRLVDVREGVTETVIYVEHRRFAQPLYYVMLTNSFSMSGTEVGARRYMKQFIYWPIALHPNPKRALLICFGVGSTAKALTDSSAVESIDIVDISRDILEMSEIIFPNPADSPLRDPRVKVHIEDGRYFLQASREKYDLITGEPPPPAAAGVVSLYTKEYFQLVHDHLMDGGIVTYWLPIDQLDEQAALSILRAFTDVFETSFLWHGTNTNLMIVGIRGPIKQASDQLFARQWENPGVASEMATLGFETPAQLGSGFIGDTEYIRQITRNASPLTDDYPKRILSSHWDNPQLYLSWIDTNATRMRFLNSAGIRALWPSGWRSRSLPYFDLESLVLTLGRAAWRDGFLDFERVHFLNTRTPLQTLVLWVLGSTGDDQAAVDRIPVEKRNTPEVNFQLGLRLLAQRDYAGAVERLRSASSEPKVREGAVATCVYALCMADRMEEAQSFIEDVSGFPETRAIPSAYWTWMQRTFGLRPPW